MKQPVKFFLFAIVMLGLQPNGFSQAVDLAINTYSFSTTAKQQSKVTLKDAPLEMQINERIKGLKQQFVGSDKVTIHFKINTLGQVNGLQVYCPKLSAIKKTTIEKTIKSWHFANSVLTEEKHIDFSMRL